MQILLKAVAESMVLLTDFAVRTPVGFKKPLISGFRKPLSKATDRFKLA
jgi:hypothetical protein